MKKLLLRFISGIYFHFIKSSAVTGQNRKLPDQHVFRSRFPYSIGRCFANTSQQQESQSANIKG
jgi:hypothetical protein